MSGFDFLKLIIGLFLFGVLVFFVLESIEKKNYKNFECKRKKTLDNNYKGHNTKSHSNEQNIDMINNNYEHQELEDFIESVNVAGFDIDEDEALEYISQGKSPEDYVTYMEYFYMGDDNISDNDDNNLEEKTEEYINDMSSLGYDISDDEAIEMTEEGFTPEVYAEEYEEEDYYDD